jgi:hypothetical protein
MNNTEKKPSLLFAAILIIVGIAFLFQNLGWVQGNLWEQLYSLWPLLIILLGVNELVRRRSIVGTSITIGIGAVLLANNLNILHWDSWISAAKLWPIIIIAIGLEIFIGRKQIFLSALGVAITLSLFALGIWYSGGQIGTRKLESQPPRNAENFFKKSIAYPLEDAESAQVEIDSSIGEVLIEALSDSENFIEGDLYSVEEEKIRQNYDIKDDKILYSLSSEWDTNVSPSFSNFDKEHLSWELYLTDEIPLDLSVFLGIGESELDLSDLQIDELYLSVGIGETQLTLPDGQYQAQIEGGIGQSVITLPNEGQIKLNVEGGIGEVVIYIPEDMVAKIYVDRGISGLSIPEDYIRQEDIYVSPNYREGKNYLELYVDQGIGNISIREK